MDESGIWRKAACGAFALKGRSGDIFCCCYFVQTGKPKCAAAKSYSKLVTANRKEKKEIQTLDTPGMKRKRKVVLSAAETRIHLLLFRRLITVSAVKERVTLKIIITATRGSFSRCYAIRVDLRLDLDEEAMRLESSTGSFKFSLGGGGVSVGIRFKKK